MDYSETDPPVALAGHVRCVWTLRSDVSTAEGGTPAPAYPDGSPELIFNFGDAFEQVLPDGRTLLQPAAFLVGQITRPMQVRPTGRIDLIAVRFEAHGAALLQRPMRLLTNKWSSLGDLHGVAARQLLEAYGESRRAQTAGDRTALLLSVLADVLSASAPSDARVVAAVRAIRLSHGLASLDALATSLGVSSRLLQRHFADEVGFTPKVLARIVRFQRVFSSIQLDPTSLAHVAADCGYYDQSHLVRDFRDFAGDAPARALAQMPEFTAFFTARRAPA